MSSESSYSGDAHKSTSYTERMIPADAHARVFWEHIERYRFARAFVREKRVLDIACGEGYGTAALAKAGAASVVGIDIAPDICEQARRNYGLDIRTGDAQAIPLPDQSIDLVVSFETIEHVPAPSIFLAECARVLVPEGELIVSTPNRPIYSSNGHQNPFHHIEFNTAEFLELLQTRFESVQLYTQFNRTVAWWSLRSLAAEQSPWLKIKGFWRLSSWICPAIRGHISSMSRSAPDALILAADGFLSSLFNPYLVRLAAKPTSECPYILVAVAKRVKTV
jgi:2-polyprenyl-3-methyl-5-hydroxy-6-metoxy-1,4-benzoquinol methylase